LHKNFTPNQNITGAQYGDLRMVWQLPKLSRDKKTASAKLTVKVNREGQS
jgi:hypothetical protein